MILKYWGHSFFSIATEGGYTLATDPYGDFYQYPARRVKADFCTVSHHHHDHDGLSCVTGSPVVFDAPGVYQAGPDVKITGVPSWHDHENGRQRGSNVIFVIETEGLRIAHAGDLGCVPTPEQQKKLGRLDVLLLPVGGYYTIDGAEALETVRLLKPAVTIPMHYRTRYNPEFPTATLDDFLRLAGEQPAPMPLLRLTKADVRERNWLAVMDIQEP